MIDSWIIQPFKWSFWMASTLIGLVVPMGAVMTAVNAFRGLSSKAMAEHQPFPTLAYFEDLAFLLIVAVVAMCFGYMGLRHLKRLRPS
jgi:cell division protein FtsX